MKGLISEEMINDRDPRNINFKAAFRYSNKVTFNKFYADSNASNFTSKGEIVKSIHNVYIELFL